MRQARRKLCIFIRESGTQITDRLVLIVDKLLQQSAVGRDTATDALDAVIDIYAR